MAAFQAKGRRHTLPFVNVPVRHTFIDIPTESMALRSPVGLRRVNSDPLALRWVDHADDREVHSERIEQNTNSLRIERDAEDGVDGELGVFGFEGCESPCTSDTWGGASSPMTQWTCCRTASKRDTESSVSTAHSRSALELVGHVEAADGCMPPPATESPPCQMVTAMVLLMPVQSGQTLMPVLNGQLLVPMQTGQPLAPAQSSQLLVPVQTGQPFGLVQSSQPLVPVQTGQPLAPAQSSQPLVLVQTGQPLALAQNSQPLVPVQTGQPLALAHFSEPLVPAQPSPSNSTTCLTWTFHGGVVESDANKFESDEFFVEVPGLGMQPFRMALYAVGKEGQPGSYGFERSCGQGRVEVRCFAQLPAGSGRFSIDIVVGEGNETQPARPSTPNDFSQRTSRTWRRWDFRSAVNPSTQRLTVRASFTPIGGAHE